MENSHCDKAGRELKLGLLRLMMMSALVLIAAYYISGAVFPEISSVFIAAPMMLLFIMAAVLGLGKQIGAPSNFKVFGLLIILAVALLLRELVFPIMTHDYNDCLEPWIRVSADLKDFTALGETIGNYNAPYFYIIFFVAKLTHRMDIALRLPYLKMTSVFFDIILAYFAMKLVLRLTGRKGLSLGAYFAVLFLPTVFINASLWGQCDAIYTAFCLGAIYYGLEKKSAACWIFFAIAFSFKLQSVFLIPMLLVLLYTKRIYWRDLWLFPAMAFLLLVPALMAGRPFLETISVYIGQTQDYSSLSLFAPSVFGFVPGSRDLEVPWAAIAGEVVALVFLFALLGYLYLRRDRLSEDGLILAALVMAMGIPFFLPHMHERYFYASEILALVAAFKKRSRLPISVLATLSSLLSYLPYLYDTFQEPIPMPILSAMMLAALLLSARELVQTVENQTPLIRA